MTAVIQEALISLDIPLNFLKPDLTNFYGSRDALDDYIDSCISKQEGLINALHEGWTEIFGQKTVLNKL